MEDPQIEARHLIASLRWLRFRLAVEWFVFGVFVAIADWTVAHQKSILLSLEALGCGDDRPLEG